MAVVETLLRATADQPPLLKGSMSALTRGPCGQVGGQPGSAGRVLSSLGREKITWEQMGAYAFKMWEHKPELLPCLRPLESYVLQSRLWKTEVGNAF